MIVKIQHPLVLAFLLAIGCACGSAAQEPELSRKGIETTGHPSRGPENALVTIVEFADFQCPYCRGLFSTLQAVQDAYPDQVRVVFRQFPLTSIHQYAQKAAEASLCAHDQGRFWEFHDSLFSNQNDIDVPALRRRAVELSMDTEQFNQCLDSGVKQQAVEEDIDEGTRNAVYSTPTMFINGLILEGNYPYQQIVNMVESELQRVEGTR